MMWETDETETESDNKKYYKYYGDMTVINLKFESKEHMSKLEKYVMLRYLNCKFSPDQCYVNEYGEVYLIFYKAYIDVNKINDIQNIRMRYVLDNDDEIEKNVVKSISVLGFSDKNSFMGFMSKCVILSCQRFLDNYYNNTGFDLETPKRERSSSESESESSPNRTHSPFEVSSSKNMKYNFSDSSESERSASLENYYIFPHTIKNLVKFSKETNIDVDQYNDMWGTWIKFDENGEPITFSGFPINQDTSDEVCSFIMSSYNKKRKCLTMNYDHKKWYETYGKICKRKINISSPNVSNDNGPNSDNSTDSESEKYVKL